MFWLYRSLLEVFLTIGCPICNIGSFWNVLRPRLFRVIQILRLHTVSLNHLCISWQLPLFLKYHHLGRACHSVTPNPVWLASAVYVCSLYTEFCAQHNNFFVFGFNSSSHFLPDFVPISIHVFFSISSIFRQLLLIKLSVTYAIYSQFLGFLSFFSFAISLGAIL